MIGAAKTPRRFGVLSWLNCCVDSSVAEGDKRSGVAVVKDQKKKSNPSVTIISRSGDGVVSDDQSPSGSGSEKSQVNGPVSPLIVVVTEEGAPSDDQKKEIDPAFAALEERRRFKQGERPYLPPSPSHIGEVSAGQANTVHQHVHSKSSEVASPVSHKDASSDDNSPPHQRQRSRSISANATITETISLAPVEDSKDEFTPTTPELQKFIQAAWDKINTDDPDIRLVFISPPDLNLDKTNLPFARFANAFEAFAICSDTQGMEWQAETKKKNHSASNKYEELEKNINENVVIYVRYCLERKNIEDFLKKKYKDSATVTKECIERSIEACRNLEARLPEIVERNATYQKEYNSHAKSGLNSPHHSMQHRM